MRIKSDGREIYVFKEQFFIRDQSGYYYARDENSLVEKHFETQFGYGSQWRFPLGLKNLVELAIKSPDAPLLKEPPKVVTTTVEEQLLEFKRYWAENFDIHMDERDRFYSTYIKMGGFYKRKNKSILGMSKDKVKIKYFKFQDLLVLYNSTNHYKSDAECRNPKLIMPQELKTHKKYAYLTLARTKKGFIITHERIVTNPV